MKVSKSIFMLLAAVSAGYVLSSANASAETIEATALTKTFATGATGSVRGVANSDDGSKVKSIEINVGDGADLTDIVGGIQISPKDYKANYDALKSANGTLSGGVVINVTGGSVSGTIYGGNTLTQTETGLGNTAEDFEATVENLGDQINVGSIKINVSGGTIGTTDGDSEAIMGGGGRYCGAETIEVNISGGTVNNKVYGGTNGGTVGSTAVNVSGGTINSNVYGGGRKSYGKTTGGTTVTLSGGTITGNVYAGGDQDTVVGTAKVVITGDGSKVEGTISGSGTNGATVKGTRSLVFDAAYTGEESYRVGDFMEVDIETAAILTSLETAAEGTLVTIADEATLTLGSVTVTEGGALEFRGGNVTIASGSLLDLNGTSITLNGTKLSSDGDFTVKVDSLDTTDYVVFNVASAEELAALEGVNITLQAGDATTTVAASSVAAVVPEPTTATLSLLALAGLAARRRRK